MPSRKGKIEPSSTKKVTTVRDDVQAAVASLKRLASKRYREQMTQFGIRPSDPEKAFGVRMDAIQKLAKGLKGKDAVRNHELAAALWQTGWYEARLMSGFVDEAAMVTPAQMDRWCRDFDNWGICDTVCFTLFDRVPTTLAFRKVTQWCRSNEEFVKRAAFALLASLALHDKVTGDEPFLRTLPLIERASSDDRNFVKKGVSWALRGIGRRNLKLHAAALKLAKSLSASPKPSARWVGNDAFRDITRPAVVQRLKARRLRS